MSEGRRPAVEPMSAGSYPQQSGQKMNQQMTVGSSPGSGPHQRFMMGGQMYGHTASQPQMYMPSSQQPPGPPMSPGCRPSTSQLSQIQNRVQNSPSRLSPAPSVTSDLGSAHELGTPEDFSGENSRGSTGIPRPTPSPVGSSGSRSNTPGSIPSGQAGSPMPVRPPSVQSDVQNRLTQSPMASPGYNQQMMPPPNSMGYIPPSGKMGGGNHIPGHYPQYNSQYPPGNYGRQQPNMGGQPASGPGQNYPGSQLVYPNGPSQVPGTAMYGNMPGMVRSIGQHNYGPGQCPQNNMSMGGMMNSQYPGYNSHMGSMPGHHGIQQTPGGPGTVLPAAGSPVSAVGGQQGNMLPRQHGSSSNKAAQAAQAAMLAAANSVGPRLSHSRGSMSPSRGIFVQSGGGPLAQMNNMTNCANLGNPSLNSMSNAVEQLARSSSGGMMTSSIGLSTSAPSPVPKSYSPASTMPSMFPGHSVDSSDQASPLLSAEIQDSLSRPSSATAPHTDLPNNESTSGSESSGGVPSDVTSVDSGFHSSDQSDKTSDSVSTPTQSGPSPPLPGLPPNGDESRTVDNISPLDHLHQHHFYQQMHPHQYHMGTESKMPYNRDLGVPLPPAAVSSVSSTSSGVVSTANAGPMSTSVTQSIASPVTSVSTSTHGHSHPHHMGPHGGPPHVMSHGMGPGHLGNMPNGMTPPVMMNPGQMGAPNQMPPNMGGSMHGMMPPNMGGPNMNMNQNGPVMGHNGLMMSGHSGMNSSSNMPPVNHMPQQMNCINLSNSTSNKPDGPPEKKKKSKKSSSDLSKLFELGLEPDRRLFLERILAFLEETGSPVTALPVISKTPLDLYKLYFSVKEKGGFEEVTRSKKWRDICTVVNIGTSASAAFTLKKNYIRYFLNYECKYDRGGINPAPILAQMEAQLAHKREQKSKRAPSPAGSNSNDSFRPPSVPNIQMDSSYQPANMPPPYMQNPDGAMPNPAAGGNMMGPNNMMAGPVPHGGMGGPPGMGPSSMMGPGSNMMHGQQGMMIPNSGTGNMIAAQMIAGGPPAYGDTVMQQQMGAMPPAAPAAGSSLAPLHGGISPAGPIQALSDSVNVQDPFSDETGYLQQSLQPPPTMPGVTSTPMTSGYTGVQSVGITAVASAQNQPVQTASGYNAADQQMEGFPQNSNHLSESSVPSSGAQFPYGPQFDHADRFEQPALNISARPPCPAPGMASGQPSPQQSGDGAPMYPGNRFPGPQQPMGIRPQHCDDTPGQYPQQGPPYQGQAGYSGPQYPSYPQNMPGSFSSPVPGGMYGTPSKRFPDEHSGIVNHASYPPAPLDQQAPSPDDRMRDGGQWSPVPRPRMTQNTSDYLSSSTPPSGLHPRQMSHGSFTHGRETARFPAPGQQKLPPAYCGLTASSITKKEISFPPGCVESTGISTTKRKKLTNKDLAPFQSWRIMLALKSGLLAESTWALDVLNILLYDDTTYSYFGLNTLPGLLEVLTEHFRHCLMQMFDEFEDLEEGLSRKPKRSHQKRKNVSADKLKPSEDSVIPDIDCKLGSEHKESVLHVTASNYTMMSRKGLPVKIDQNPVDCSVLDTKEWDVYTNFNSKADYWLTGHGDITDHVLTHLESDQTHQFLCRRFRRKRTREGDNSEDSNDALNLSKALKGCPIEIAAGQTVHCESGNCVSRSQRGSFVVKGKDSAVLNERSPENDSQKSTQELGVPTKENSNLCISHSLVCNGETSISGHVQATSECNCASNAPGCNENRQELSQESRENCKTLADGKRQKKVQKSVSGTKAESVQLGKPDGVSIQIVESIKTEVEMCHCELAENGEILESKLSPISNHITCSPNKNELENVSVMCKAEHNSNNNCQPRLKAELDGVDGAMVGGTEEPVGITMNNCKTAASMEANSGDAVDRCRTNAGQAEEANSGQMLSDGSMADSSDTLLEMNDSFMSETDELSASIVTEMLKEEEHLEEEALQRDDPPLCVTPESREELGRRCVCISNIFRSLSCVPGNEARIGRHPGIMRVLGRLLLLHHSHPERPPPRKLPCGEEEEDRDPAPRVWDDEHWWWDYVDQLRENTLVIIANISGHLRLASFSEQVCHPLIEGLIHWVVCPASAARDPLPTLPAGSVLSPQRLVLEAFCKLCIHETNVDLLLATPPVKKLLEFFSVLVRLLADRNQQITLEFSIVLLSFLVPGDSSAARAVALQHPSVSLLVDFIETAEQNALTIANQQGLEVLQSNPEIMGTSLDMLRRAASILLHMARVPDNRRLFVQQQKRLLNLVMSQILEQSVSNTLCEVLFECSQQS